ncbi:MAG: DUF420 domain-containing protein [Planctomycetota bacterium]
MKGFLGTDADLVIDLFLVSLVALLPMLCWAIALVRQGKTAAHGKWMAVSYAIFVTAVLGFEIDVRLRSDVLPSPKFWPFLIHMHFALPAFVLWTYQIATARRVAAAPAAHRKRGKILITLIFLTVATGIWLYVETFA